MDTYNEDEENFKIPQKRKNKVKKIQRSAKEKKAPGGKFRGKVNKREYLAITDDEENDMDIDFFVRRNTYQINQ